MKIIAECAQGYEGKMVIADLLAEGAINSGADYIKYQLIYADEISVPSYEYYNFFKSLEMQDTEWMQISRKIKKNNKLLLFDVFGDLGLEKAKKFGAAGVKITTTDFFNFPLICKSLALFDEVFISVGGIQINEINDLLIRLDGKQKSKITLMYGFQAEPTPLEKNNLSRLLILSATFPEVKLGFMDHVSGSSRNILNVSLLAIGAGAVYVEKHITVSRSLDLEDSISALNLDELGFFVNDIKTLSKAMGRREFTLSEDELLYRSKAQKVVVASRPIAEQTIIDEHSITLKRVNISSELNYNFALTDVIGQLATTSYEINQPIIVKESK